MQKLLQKILPVIALFLFFSVCSASLTIWFKDGSNKEVHKITFKGNSAELYCVDGTVMNVSVDKIDLPSSGIGAPVGTYGTSKVTGQRTLSEKKEVLGSPLRQARLREEWEESEKTAVVTSAIGAMQKGDTVKIVRETTRNSRPRPEDYFDNKDVIYDPVRNTYEFREKDLDHAYVIIYKNQDGSYGKRLFDAVTFNAHFKISEGPPKTPAPMPEYPIIPDEKNPEVRETSPFIKSQPKTETEPQPEPQPGTEAVEESGSQSPVMEEPDGSDLGTTSRRRSWIAYLVFVFVVAALGLGAWYVINKSQKPYIDTSKFSRYEDDLREFEIGIWLRNGKTTDQLMEICLKKFYQDSPSILTVCNKMLKGSQKGMMAPVIAKHTGRSIAEAERIYDQIQNQIERIRNLIKEVTLRTGLSPAKPPVEVTSKTVPADLPRVAPTPKETVPVPPPLPKQAPAPMPQPSVPSPVVVGNSTSSVVLNEKPSATHLIEPEAPMRTATDLPGYANGVLNQIGFLSSSEDK